MLYTTIDTPIGELLLVGDGEALHRVSMQDARPLYMIRAGNARTLRSPGPPSS